MRVKACIPLSAYKNFKYSAQCKDQALQLIFKYDYPKFYSNGIFGWCTDHIVDFDRDLIIATGVSGKHGTKIPKGLIVEFDKKARNILSSNEPIEVIKEKMELNRNEFCDTLIRFLSK